MSFEGACHCGDVVVLFETAKRAQDIEVRADQCSFCRSRGARTVSDPIGGIAFRMKGRAHPYRFGLKTADFWLCNRCGAYVGATTEIDGQLYGVLNVAGTQIKEFDRRTGRPVDYSSEDAATRMARRKQKWTPATITK